MSRHRDYDSTVARIAGNLLSGVATSRGMCNDLESLAERAVALARAIVEETRRTEPKASGDIGVTVFGPSGVTNGVIKSADEAEQ